NYREALRQTWLKDCKCNYFFIIGGADKTYIEKDVLYVAAPDDYIHVPEKQLEAIKFCTDKFKFDHLFICDDDAYVCYDKLIDSNYHLHDYYGCGPVRMWDVPYYITGGPGICLSNKA